MPKLLDPETCSWCTEEVEDSSLTDTSEGRLCKECVNEVVCDDIKYRHVEFL
jgi:hypothetical protein